MVSIFEFKEPVKGGPVLAALDTLFARHIHERLKRKWVATDQAVKRTAMASPLQAARSAEKRAVARAKVLSKKNEQLVKTVERLDREVVALAHSLDYAEAALKNAREDAEGATRMAHMFRDELEGIAELQRQINVMGMALTRIAAGHEYARHVAADALEDRKPKP